MILTDREIISALEHKHISIEPRPDPKSISSMSVDLRLAKQIRIWEKSIAGLRTAVQPASPGYSYEEIAERCTSRAEITEAGFTLEPNTFLLAWTAENVDFPCHSKICARVEGKSSLARLGISVHQTAPVIHAGFKGQIQLEICHLGVLPVILNFGMPICQLILEQTFGTPQKGYKGQFYDQTFNKLTH
jgi:dCTP deaminase